MVSFWKALSILKAYVLYTLVHLVNCLQHWYTPANTHNDTRTATTTQTSVLEHPINGKIEAFIKYIG